MITGRSGKEGLGLMENRTSVATNGYSRPRPTRRGKPCIPRKAVHADDLTSAARAAIANGSAPLPYAVDGRTILAKRYRSIASQLCADQGGGGLSEARLQLIARFAGAAVLAEQIETQIISGGAPIKIEEYSGLISSLVRIANKIGLDRIPRNVSLDLKSYLDRRQTIDAEAEDKS
jgi:hypothetical protein